MKVIEWLIHTCIVIITFILIIGCCYGNLYLDTNGPDWVTSQDTGAVLTAITLLEVISIGFIGYGTIMTMPSFTTKDKE